MWTNHGSRTVIAVAAALLGCSSGGGDKTPTTPTPVLTSIAVTGGTTVQVGATLALVASPKDQSGNAFSATVTWSSGAANIATVSSTGVVTGVTPGTAVITATSGGVNTPTTITVTAVPVLTSITVSGGTALLTGATLQLSAAAKDQNGAAIAATIGWSSGAAGVATVSSSGVVTGVAPGTAVITAASGIVNATVTVTVSARVLTTITLAGGASVVIGQTLQLTASPKDQSGTAFAATITWTSGATGIATVSNSGLVSGVALGTAVITAASGSVNATSTITVTAVPPTLTTITISGGTTVVATSTLQLTAAPKDQNGNAIAATVTWSSGAAGVATVGNTTGLVTGVAAGSAVITATSGSVTANVTVTVTPQVLTTITVSGGTTVQAGQTLQLIAAAKDQNGKPMTAVLTWASDATGVATVNAASGLVTGVAAGSANITASSGGINGTAAITVTAAPVFPATASVSTGPGNVFTPASVDIAINGTVSWTFGATHNVTFDAVSGAPANIGNSSGATVARTFSAAGTFTYQCTLHSGMTAQVIVHP